MVDEPDEPVGELRFMARCHFYGGETLQKLAAKTKLAHHGEVACLEYIDEADQHWTLLVDGPAYRASVSPFLAVGDGNQVEQTGSFDWKPDEILMTLPGWHADWALER